MDSLEIDNLMKEYRQYVGTYSRDTLPNSITLPVGLIANTDTSDKPGTHWIAIYIDEKGVGEYFDSYGLPPLHKEFVDFIFRNSSDGSFYNRIQLQCLSCITCGHYCVAYLKMRFHGLNYCHFISLFTSNRLQNDIIIKKFITQ